jgi:cytochrome c
MREMVVRLRHAPIAATLAGMLCAGGVVSSAAHAQSAPNYPSSMKWSVEGEKTPMLGRGATPEEIAAYDIDANPDGSGLPPGRGTPAQGALVYAETCQSCHGEKGKGPNYALVGGGGTIGKGEHQKPLKTVGSFWPYATSVFAYIRRAMPYFESKSLTPDELYAVTAYMLQLNGLIGENDVMDKSTLPKVAMPNKDGFFQWKPGTP